MLKKDQKGKKALRQKQHNRKSSKDQLLELVVELDRVHTENRGRISVDEMRLRVIIRISLNIKALANKIKAIKKFIYKKFLRWIFDHPSP